MFQCLFFDDVYIEVVGGAEKEEEGQEAGGCQMEVGITRNEELLIKNEEWKN
jgi:hypothetical protein